MLHDKLFERVLIEPAQQGANHLSIVSGYATAAMVARHLRKLLVENELDVSIELIVGMTPRDGISLTDHLGFRNFVSDSFSCKYVIHKPAVHSKLYVWSWDDNPVTAFTGSANYTQTAFSKQREILTKTEPEQARAYFQSLADDVMHCEHPDIHNHVKISTSNFPRTVQTEQIAPVENFESGRALQSATLSLLTADGTRVHGRSGLNWGQRAEERRNPDQAYIPVYAPLKNTDFFPSSGIYFTAHTDDGETLTLTRAQEGDKAIHTPWDNSQLGRYFRQRLGIPSGAFVTKDDLIRYGRTDVTFHKINDETYLMDFSVPGE